MFFTIYEFDPTSHEIEIIHEGNFFKDMGFEFPDSDEHSYYANPQRQAFM